MVGNRNKYSKMETEPLLFYWELGTVSSSFNIKIWI